MKTAKTIFGIFAITMTLAMNGRSQTNQPLPIILNQPQNQVAVVGSNVTFSVTATTASPPLPVISSGTLQLWLKADVGVVTNGAGLVSQWQDQSGNANDASQANASNQPLLVSAAGLGGEPAIRFNGSLDPNSGSYMFGSGLVNVPNAMTSFTVYNGFSTATTDIILCLIGMPGANAACRADDIYADTMLFVSWNDDYFAGFTIPTDTYRIWNDRLDTNLDTLNMFDATATSTTGFTNSVTGMSAPGAGYYVGGLGSSRNFDGDIAEFIVYQGYLSSVRQG